jgi:sugar lactone lactonase YvrE
MDRNHSSWKLVAGCFMAATLMLALLVPVLAGGHVTTLIQYDRDAGQLPEGIAVDKTGNVYVSLAPLGIIQKISRDGTVSTFAALPPPAPGGFGVLGLAVDAPGTVYAANTSADPATQGVYRIGKDGVAERMAGSEAITAPNALAFDKQGNLYVTDTIFGAVWRIPRGGSAELWLHDETLVGFVLPDPAAPPVPLGANGIAYWKGSLYVANTSEAHIVRIPILGDGSAGTPEIFVKDPLELTPLDGIALDVHGNIYAAVIAQSKVVRIDPASGAITTVATAADGLDFTASLAFGTGNGERQSLYGTNFTIGPPGGAGPAVVKIDVGVPGNPLP